MYSEQVKNNWTGPVKEGDNICEQLNIPKISCNDIYKDEIEDACKKKAENDIKEEMKGSSKMKSKIEEGWQRREYLENKKIHEARAMFRFRSKMADCKMNYPNEPRFKKDLWMCDSCRSAIDSQSHVMICPAYKELREGKDINDDGDVANYLAAVLQIRTKLGLRK